MIYNGQSREGRVEPERHIFDWQAFLARSTIETGVVYVNVRLATEKEGACP